MSKRMQEYRKELKLLENCNSSSKTALLKHGHGNLIRAVVDAIWTTLEGKLPLSPDHLSIVRKNKSTLQRIASKNRTIHQRRQLLCTRTGGNAAIDLIKIVNQYF